MGLHKKAINAILNLSSQERYEHTLKRITICFSRQRRRLDIMGR